MLKLNLFLKSVLLSVLFFFVTTNYAFASEDSNFYFSAVSGSESGTVTLSWDNKDFVENYNIAYGPSAGHHLYGVTNVGNISSYTIGGLTPGQTYYFVLSPVDDGSALPYTSAVSATAAQ